MAKRNAKNKSKQQKRIAKANRRKKAATMMTKEMFKEYCRKESENFADFLLDGARKNDKTVMTCMAGLAGGLVLSHEVENDDDNIPNFWMNVMSMNRKLCIVATTERMDDYYLENPWKVKGIFITSITTEPLFRAA